LQLILTEKRLGPPTILIAVKNERKKIVKHDTGMLQARNSSADESPSTFSKYNSRLFF